VNRLLSLLAEEPNPVHPYSLYKQLVDLDVNGLLKSGIELGYVEKSSDRWNNPFYAITDAGRAALMVGNDD